jgi:hypothetical protein
MPRKREPDDREPAMKLPVKIGLPLLGLLLLGVSFTEGRENLLLIVLAMGVALWTAFSLPHPGPRRGDPTLVERSLRDADDPHGPPDEDAPANGSGTGRPPG